MGLKPIREVAAGYGLSVSRAGFCKCPFHSERTASMKLYENEQRFHCFGCGKHGSVIDLVEHFEGCGFGRAYELLGGNAVDFRFDLISADARKERERARGLSPKEAIRKYEKTMDELEAAIRASENAKYRVRLMDEWWQCRDEKMKVEGVLNGRIEENGRATA